MAHDRYLVRTSPFGVISVSVTGTDTLPLFRTQLKYISNAFCQLKSKTLFSYRKQKPLICNDSLLKRKCRTTDLGRKIQLSSYSKQFVIFTITSNRHKFRVSLFFSLKHQFTFAPQLKTGGNITFLLGSRPSDGNQQ